MRDTSSVLTAEVRYTDEIPDIGRVVDPLVIPSASPKQNKSEKMYNYFFARIMGFISTVNVQIRQEVP